MLQPSGARGTADGSSCIFGPGFEGGKQPAKQAFDLRPPIVGCAGEWHAHVWLWRK